MQDHRQKVRGFSNTLQQQYGNGVLLLTYVERSQHCLFVWTRNSLARWIVFKKVPGGTNTATFYYVH